MILSIDSISAPPPAGSTVVSVVVVNGRVNFAPFSSFSVPLNLNVFAPLVLVPDSYTHLTLPTKA